jgi:LuxR family maltose regulon positive regulatory protein
MANLLYQLTRRGKVDEFHHNLVNAFMEAKPTMSKLPADELIEPLTERELDVLQLLAMRLINKEIAERLVISPGTVKSHTIRIYRKLDVKGRREAVERAAALGIIPTY